MTPLIPVLLAACAAIDPASDQVRLRDLAPAFPHLAMSAPDTPVGFAPAPGVVRRFHIPELRRIAVRLNLDTAPEREVCVTRPVAPPDPQRFLAAMQARFPQARIELLDYSRWPVPAGEIEFPVSGLHQDYWRGDVRYAGSLRFAIWAKVKVRVTVGRVVAISDLALRRPVPASALRLDEIKTEPGTGGYADSVAAVAGKLPRRAIPAGTAIQSGWLEQPPLIARGDRVNVEVRSGAALVKLEGQAQADGSAGQSIPILNPATGKSFRARIAGPGRVVVESLP